MAKISDRAMDARWKPSWKKTEERQFLIQYLSLEEQDSPSLTDPTSAADEYIRTTDPTEVEAYSIAKAGQMLQNAMNGTP